MPLARTSYILWTMPFTIAVDVTVLRPAATRVIVALDPAIAQRFAMISPALPHIFVIL